MSYRETEDDQRETYRAWADRMTAEVRELEAIASFAPDVPATCPRCGHYVLPVGRCLGCEVEGVRG